MYRIGVAVLTAAFSFALCMGQPARADEAGAAPSPRMDIAPVPDDEISSLFTDFCLRSFPDPSALDKLAGDKSGVAMNPREVSSFLHSDPGRGWTVRTAQALYAITIEFPPYNACAVRFMTPSGIAGVPHYLAAMNAYVSAKSGKLAGIPPQKGKTPDGADVSFFGYGMMDGGGKPTETFLLFLTNYHGRVPPGPWREGAGSGDGVEVRMVHQLVKQ